jgi:hypothetical protein
MRAPVETETTINGKPVVVGVNAYKPESRHVRETQGTKKPLVKSASSIQRPFRHFPND